ncbi:hypothetical protein NE237_027692 [Protea cynaroides]|uniref:Uncharacterized protein n=1 Tax=Protea cynaroides TaxID=273540 RepID=A0A9Q0GQZ7_9MAGN|nr:hypothetical protein NE237_027692 [Protea cynaroides]
MRQRDRPVHLGKTKLNGSKRVNQTHQLCRQDRPVHIDKTEVNGLRRVNQMHQLRRRDWPDHIGKTELNRRMREDQNAKSSTPTGLFRSPWPDQAQWHEESRSKDQIHQLR